MCRAYPSLVLRLTAGSLAWMVATGGGRPHDKLREPPPDELRPVDEGAKTTGGFSQDGRRQMANTFARARLLLFERIGLKCASPACTGEGLESLSRCEARATGEPVEAATS